MESMANLMIFCGICRKFDKFHGKQQNAMANPETGVNWSFSELFFSSHYSKSEKKSHKSTNKKILTLLSADLSKLPFPKKYFIKKITEH